MTGRTFVDTNILVYARDSGFPEKQRAAIGLLEELWTNRTGRVSVQVCSEYFVTVTRKRKPGLDESSAWEDVEALSAWDPFPLDQKTLVKAREGQILYGLSWWDSLIVASAFQGECERIASENFVVGQSYFGIAVINPLK
jgi:predicted nucleic acid-binding protein